jgi:uncharacterized protein (TIGR03435 family)
MRALVGLVCGGVCALALYGQSGLVFEVVSIKLSPPAADSPHGDCLGTDSHPGKFNPGLGRCAFQSNTLKDLISAAYSPVYPGGRLGFPSDRIELPKGAEFKWIGSQAFDIQAKAPNPVATTEANIYQMLQQMLTDDFRLKIHSSTREVTGLILRVEPAGAKLKAATGGEQRQNMIGGGPPGVRPVVGQATPIAAIVNLLTRAAQRPVQDQTGLTGLYNWSLAWAADESNASDVSFAPALVTAVKEQLGLRLEQGKVPEDILVVEYAEKPRTN